MKTAIFIFQFILFIYQSIQVLAGCECILTSPRKDGHVKQIEEMSAAATWQQILALDAKYNTIRVPSNPQFRTQYIRRRSQLLPEKNTSDPTIRKQYLKLRSQILTCRYGYIADQRAMVGGTSISENYEFAGVYFVFDQHSNAVTSVRFANDDKSKLACCSQDGTLSICQVHPPPAHVIFLLQGHTAGVTGFEWSLANDVIVSCSLDKTIRLWETQTGTCLRTVVDNTPSPVYSCTFQPLNNNMIVTGNQKGLVQVLNISTGIYCKDGLVKMSGKVLALTFDSSGKILWAGDDKGTIMSFLYDLATGYLNRGHKLVVCEARPITCLSARNWVSRQACDPSLLVNCAFDALTLFRITDKEGSLRYRKKFAISHRSLPIKSSFCPIMSFRMGACVVTGSEDCCVYVFDIENNRMNCVNKLQAHSSPVLDVCFNCDESLLASSDAL
uniref:Uncharacterized protein n=1 Tax=Strigamia maritima TaxID=126957 RepID=T1JHG3_STRMM